MKKLISSKLRILIPACIAVTLIFCAAAPAQPEGEPVERVIAKIDNRVITLSELKLYIELKEIFTGQPSSSLSFSDQLDRLIEDILILKQASKFQVAHATDKEIAENYKTFTGHFASSEEQNSWMEARDLTEEQLKAWIADRVLLDKFIYRRVALLVHVTPSQVNQYFAEHAGEFTGLDEDAAKAKIKDILHQKHYNDRYRNWIGELKQRSDITIIK
jgi:hypothetical protein